MRTAPSAVLRFYKAEDQKFAEAFVRKGQIRLYPQKRYKELEADAREDSSEGLGELYKPDQKLAQLSFPGKNVSRVVGMMSCGAVALDHVYILCTSLPEVDKAYMVAKMGPIVVEIFNLDAFIAALKNAVAKILGNERCFEIEAVPVQYDKGEVVNGEISNEELFSLSCEQKPRKYKDECEYRFVVRVNILTEGADREFLDLLLQDPESFVRYAAVEHEASPNHTQDRTAASAG